MRTLLLVITLLLAGGVQADNLDHNQAWQMRQKGEILPAHQLIDKAVASHPDARLLEMKLKRKQGRYLYKLQLLLGNGQVKKLYYDAKSGELVREKIYKD